MQKKASRCRDAGWEHSSDHADSAPDEYQIYKNHYQRYQTADPENDTGLIDEDIENGMKSNNKTQDCKRTGNPQAQPVP